MYLFYFEKLEVWQKSVDLSTDIYSLSSTFPQEEKFGITNQIRRASTSISANLAEGASRIKKEDKARFINQAYSSCMEVLNFIIIARKLSYIDEITYLEVREKIEYVSNQLNSFYKVVKNG